MDKENKDKGCSDGEFLIPGPVMPDGTAQLLHHHSDHSVSVDYVKQVEDGEDISGEKVFKLVEREDGPGYRKEVLYDGSKGGRPALVNSLKFRSGWDNVFGKKSDKAPN